MEQDERQTRAQLIWETYLQPFSPFEVNIGDGTRELVSERFFLLSSSISRYILLLFFFFSFFYFKKKQKKKNSTFRIHRSDFSEVLFREAKDEICYVLEHGFFLCLTIACL